METYWANVHTSGSSTLSFDPQLKEFIQENLIEIKNYDDYCELYFRDEIKHVDILQEIPGFIGIDKNKVSFHFDLGIIENQDVGAIIKDVNKCLLTELKSKGINDIDDTYYKLIENITSVGDMYSSFIELVLSILYVDRYNEIIRYQIKNGSNPEIYKKYSIKEAHNFISPILSLLYEPNIHSIKKYYDNMILENKYCVSIYEKIWMDLV